MADGHVLFVVGGARSGKSDFAVRHAAARASDVTFVATATAGDADMEERIRRHQADRPAHWNLIEAPITLVDAVGGADPASVLVVDCLTLWVSNLLLDDLAEPAILDLAGSLARILGERDGDAIVVSNEVGLGVHPGTELGATYRDVLGRVNQLMARQADRSFFFVAGQALELGDPFEMLQS